MFMWRPVPPPGNHVTFAAKIPVLLAEMKDKLNPSTMQKLSILIQKAKKLKAFVVENKLAQTILKNLEISDRKHAFNI